MDIIEIREQRVFYFRAKEVPRQQASQSVKGKEVVDIPVNETAQRLIANLRRDIAGMESLLEIYNRYEEEEDFQKIAYVIRQQGSGIMDKAISLAQLRPQMIEKIL